MTAGNTTSPWRVFFPNDPEKTLPLCIGGKRECPPEDVGGVYGYYHFLEAFNDPNHPEHEEYREWVREDFDPEYFDVNEINEILSKHLS